MFAAASRSYPTLGRRSLPGEARLLPGWAGPRSTIRSPVPYRFEQWVHGPPAIAGPFYDLPYVAGDVPREVTLRQQSHGAPRYLKQRQSSLDQRASRRTI